MTTYGFAAQPPRLTDAERDQALAVLRESAADGRVSHRTFERRMDLVLHARHPGELYAVLHDLNTRRPRAGLLERLLGSMSAFPARMRRAWLHERLPELLLPGPGPYPLSIGRAPGSVLRLNDHTVSRAHAQLRHTGVGWSLRDLGSSNGTWVNGRRVTGSVVVGPGDHVRFGRVGFRLTAP
ncbi:MULTISPECIES: DUF1707 and FHA domain-containing protein [unclassified Streptomyces]|uniref:DUF1707 and FHA domain-containing protein n=1 Tax=unclassified Streptomyces TaxID=2593676 RepID=UPI0022B6C812|nr:MULTISPECIES: DUF1707 and FHA domain-containing protein [unclassified Streptomyces]MCZ7415958.1 DUF1707 and FHA domain-containing protein [Streptomyces sp. WMMC897]MCZ7434233.1 DUF1707 and FHA domain-containing protein [Streptomyces sp. WMMC1477]